MSSMKAVGLYRYLPISDPESLLDVEVERPTPAEHDLLVRVQAISVNPVDVKRRAPKEGVEKSPVILGWDVAGTVESVGAACTLFKPGDEVYYAGDVTRPGCYSEYHLIDERLVGRKPTTLDYAEAAALPLTSLTAWEALFERLNVSHEPAQNEGKRILIINAAGGVGSIATQLAHLAGLTVVATASRPESVKWAKAHGADYVINHRQPLVPQLKKLGFATTDYILCLHDTDQHWNDMAEAVAPEGKVCSIVETDQPLSQATMMSKSATFVWEFMFTRSMYKLPDMIEQHRILDAVADLIDSDTIRTTLTKRLAPINAANLREAHALLEKGGMIGKLVLVGF